MRYSAWSVIGGLGVLAFEYWTYGQSVVRVSPVLWKVRVLLYFIVAAPGYFGFLYDELMPVFLPAIFCTITAIVNIFASIAASHPDSCPSDDPKAGMKYWGWTICSTSAAQKQATADAGGKQPLR